jgi:hypothetical protein
MKMLRDAGAIILIRTSTGWSARFSGEAADEIRRLFKTDTIPTAFTAEAPAGKVQQQIRAQWPKCLVTVQEGE